MIPLCAFMVTTILALLMSPQPDVGMGAVRKFVLFTMGILAANLCEHSIARADLQSPCCWVWRQQRRCLRWCNSGSLIHVFLATQSLADDPTVLARITGFMGHWMTFSGELNARLVRSRSGHSDAREKMDDSAGHRRHGSGFDFYAERLAWSHCRLCRHKCS
jgi:hypothetical protein